MATKTAHEKKLDELNFLANQKVASETKVGRIGCFGTLLNSTDSPICMQCNDLQACFKELEKTRHEQLADLEKSCKAASEAPPEPIIEPTPEATPEPTPAAKPKPGQVDWAAAIAHVIENRPASYGEMTKLLVDLLESWGGLDSRRYRKYQEIAYKLRDKGLISFDDHKTDPFIWN